MSFSAIVHTSIMLVKYAVVLVLLVVGFKLWVKYGPYNSCRIDSEDRGMRPAIGRTRLYLNYDRNAWTDAELTRGDIVVTFSKSSSANTSVDEKYPFRVVAAPGDWFKIQGGHAMVNDRPESYPDAEISATGNYDIPHKVLMPRGYVYLLPDNRASCFGEFPKMVPVSRIIGKARL